MLRVRTTTEWAVSVICCHRKLCRCLPCRYIVTFQYVFDRIPLPMAEIPTPVTHAMVRQVEKLCSVDATCIGNSNQCGPHNMKVSRWEFDCNHFMSCAIDYPEFSRSGVVNANLIQSHGSEIHVCRDNVVE